MLFNSAEFLLFFPLVALLYYLLPARLRWVLLLAASYLFYASWRIEYLALIITSTTIDYLAGMGIVHTTDATVRKRYLTLSILSNLGILFAFKYWGFFSATVNEALGLAIPNADLVLPIGISFYTFQSMSYTIDVYRGQVKVERNFGRFALYIAFFPQLVAGPIERAKRLLPQLRQHVQFEYHAATSGMRLIAWGFFKKVVIADRLGQLVDAVYGAPQTASSLALLLATVFFAFQIYCDFSGYSDIAIGCARFLGVRLMPNFRQPYFATSLREFWQRWHISLSTWFRDYLYIPLGGNRGSHLHWGRNILLVFVVSGLWHGANWTFVLWGAIHGVGLILERIAKRALKPYRLTERLGQRLTHSLQFIVTMLFVMVAWIFFRANTVADAWYIVTHLATPSILSLTLPTAWSAMEITLSVLFLGLLLGLEWLIERYALPTWFVNRPISIRWALYICITATVLFFGVSNDQPFIYFQF